MVKINLGNGNIAQAQKVVELDPELFKRIVNTIPNRLAGQRTIAEAPLNKIVLYTADPSMMDADVHNAYDVNQATVYLHMDEREMRAAMSKNPSDIKVVTRAMLLISEFWKKNKTDAEVALDRKNHRSLLEVFKNDKITQLKVYDEFIQVIKEAIFLVYAPSTATAV